jgi:hypothetical protein
MRGKGYAVCVAALIALLAGSAMAQHHGHHGKQQQHHRPYAGMQERAVKALSPEQIADLKAGRGMGLALAAELNGYPGPLHVLELGTMLGLSSEQTKRTRELYESMKAEAIAAGDALISAERTLDRAFAERAITPDALEQLTARVGEAQGKLRAVHLKYHITMADLLSPAQMERYSSLRGYR